MSYITTDQAKSYLGVTTSTDDVLITTAIASAEAYIDAYTGRTFETGEASERKFDSVLDVEGAMLYIDHLATADDLVIVNGDGVTLTSGQYTTAPRRAAPYYAIQLLSSSGVSWTYSTDSENAISITGKWGYSVTAPPLVVEACYQLTKWLYKQKDLIGSDASRPLMTGDGAVIMPSAMPASVKSMLRPYRRLS